MIYLPTDTQHVLVLGRTGSGKTMAAGWLLSKRDFKLMPWIVFDTKRDEFIEQIGRIENVKEIQITDNPPTEPGLYIVRPLPNQEEEINSFLWKVWQRGHCGLYFDEGYMIGKAEALNAILTQGRAKRIPVIMLAQRPAWLSRFAFSEMSFYMVFALNDVRDRKTIQGLIPYDLEKRLPEYNSLWYDVVRDRVSIFAPVPPKEETLNVFRNKLAPAPPTVQEQQQRRKIFI